MIHMTRRGSFEISVDYLGWIAFAVLIIAALYVFVRRYLF